MSEPILIALIGAGGLVIGALISNLFNAPKIRAEVKKLKIEREDELQKQIDELRVDNNKLFVENRSITKRLDRTQQDYENLQTSHAALETNTAAKDHMNALLNTALERKNVEIDIWMQKNVEKEKLISALNKENQELKAEKDKTISDLQAEVESLKSKFGKLSDDTAKIKAATGRLKHENA